MQVEETYTEKEVDRAERKNDQVKFAIDGLVERALLVVGSDVARRAMLEVDGVLVDGGEPRDVLDLLFLELVDGPGRARIDAAHVGSVVCK